MEVGERGFNACPITDKNLTAAETYLALYLTKSPYLNDPGNYLPN